MVIEEAALAADLITGLIFKHLERILIAKAAGKANFHEFGRASGEIINLRPNKI